MKYGLFNTAVDITEFPALTCLGVSVMIVGLPNIFLNVYFIPLFEKLQTIDAVVLVALITGFGTIAAQVISKYLEINSVKKRELTEKRKASYMKLLQIISNRVNTSSNYDKKQLAQDIEDYSEFIILYGSRNVIYKWYEYQNVVLSQESDVSVRLATVNLMNALRKDMGLEYIDKKDELYHLIKHNVSHVL